MAQRAFISSESDVKSGTWRTDAKHPGYVTLSGVILTVTNYGNTAARLALIKLSTRDNFSQKELTYQPCTQSQDQPSIGAKQTISISCDEIPFRFEPNSARQEALIHAKIDFADVFADT